ncbi:MAG: DUF1015 domain-containing protein [Treponema sp.]|jgi:hypothetical protein|nr:DUF1015 domain-containing protein [Treponema sp.]
MQNLQQQLADLGIAIPELLLPRPDMDLEKWAVIACDQFTQDRVYWAQVADRVGPAPSTLHLIFPEIYIEDPGQAERIRNIHKAMDSYLARGIFSPPKKGLVYLERSTPYHQCRRGLMLTVDLEQYDWKAHTRSLIRATEGTIAERLPPRMAVRRGAALESPHVILLIDDEADVLLPGLGAQAKKAGPSLYHTSLQGGAISGWLLDQETAWAYLAEGLQGLVQKGHGSYGNSEGAPFLYAVGDGNHSLASAKAIWEEYKSAHVGEPGLMAHPTRWALVEVENLYDPGIGFEPIHRLIFGTDLEAVLHLLSDLPGFTSRPVAERGELSALVGDEGALQSRLGLITGTEFVLVEVEASGLATDYLQPLVDAFIKHTPGTSIDYIHEEADLCKGAHPSSKSSVGILLPPVKKSGLFKTVARRGPLPRKSFSMGKAIEKRFYFECRRLF